MRIRLVAIAAVLALASVSGCSSPEGAGPEAGGSDPPGVLDEKEAVRARFQIVLDAFLEGGATASDLDGALRTADRDLAAHPSSAWNGAFETEPRGLSSARVLVAADHLVPEARAWALDHLDRADEGEEMIRAALGSIRDVRPERLGALGRLDLASKFDSARLRARESLDEVSSLRPWTLRALPEGRTDLLGAGGGFWKTEGGLSFEREGGALVLRGSGEGGRLDSLHFFLGDFTVRLTLSIEKGGLDLLVRSVPGRKSSFSLGVNRGELPDPLVLTVKVEGDTAEFMGGDGGTLQEITSDRAPSGGGLAFLLHRESVVRITSLALEKR